MDKRDLISISLTLHQLELAIIEGGGELSPQIEQAISVETIVKEKAVDRYNAVFKRCDSLAEEINERIETLSKMVKTIRSTQNLLKSNIKTAMTILSTDELTGQEVRFKLTTGGNKVVVIDEGQIPISYFNEVVKYDLDKERVKADLLTGTSIDGCTLEPIQTLRTYASISQKKLGDQ